MVKESLSAARRGRQPAILPAPFDVPPSEIPLFRAGSPTRQRYGLARTDARRRPLEPPCRPLNATLPAPRAALPAPFYSLSTPGRWGAGRSMRFWQSVCSVSNTAPWSPTVAWTRPAQGEGGLTVGEGISPSLGDDPLGTHQLLVADPLVRPASSRARIQGASSPACRSTDRAPTAPQSVPPARNTVRVRTEPFLAAIAVTPSCRASAHGSRESRTRRTGVGARLCRCSPRAVRRHPRCPDSRFVSSRRLGSLTVHPWPSMAKMVSAGLTEGEPGERS